MRTRDAVLPDAEQIHALISAYSGDGTLLPRTLAEICENVVVMYAGKVVEEAPVRGIFNSPQHPYTEGLLRSIPHLGFRRYRNASDIRCPAHRDRACEDELGGSGSRKS